MGGVCEHAHIRVWYHSILPGDIIISWSLWATPASLWGLDYPARAMIHCLPMTTALHHSTWNWNGKKGQTKTKTSKVRTRPSWVGVPSPICETLINLKGWLGSLCVSSPFHLTQPLQPSRICDELTLNLLHFCRQKHGIQYFRRKGQLKIRK